MNIRLLNLLVLACFLATPSFAQETPATTPQPGMARVETFDDLVSILQGDKINHEANTEEEYAVIPIDKGGLKSAQVIRWAARDGVVHFIQVIPLKIPKENLAAFESAIVRMNHSFPVPGLGMNHENMTPYFRLTVPLQPRGHILENEVKEYFSFCVNQSIQFYPTLAAISKGEVPAENALTFHRERIQASLGPLGVWKREFGGSKWVLLINQKGEVTLRKDGEVAVDSLITVKDGQMTFDDLTGPLAVEEKGVYKFKVEGGTMTFTPAEDPSEGRKQVLSGGPWSR